MGRFLMESDKEFMKRTIQVHEEIFRKQVYELHSLYRVQKLLMRDMNSQLKKQRILSYAHAKLGNHENVMSSNLPRNTPRHQRQPRLALDLPAEEYIEIAEEDRMLEKGDENEIELTQTTGKGRRKREEKSFTSDSASGFSSSSIESGGLKLNGHEWTLEQVEDLEVSYQNGINSRLEFEEGTREESSSCWLSMEASLFV